jgi:hypothetical protein
METDAPGAAAAATISRLSASDQMRRWPRLLVSIITLVDTYRTALVQRQTECRLSSSLSDLPRRRGVW